MAYEYRLPDVGEGLVEAEIVSWKVKPGDQVAVNDVIVEIETSKSLVELPCPYGGRIGQLLVPEGQVVEVGSPIVAIETEDGTDAEPTADASSGTGASSGQGEEDVKTLVGYGPSASSTRRRPRRRTGAAASGDAGAEREQPAGTAPAARGAAETASTRSPAQPTAQPAAQPAQPAQPTAPSPQQPTVQPEQPERSAQPAAARAGGPVPAKPPVRKLAKDLGIDLSLVPASGPQGTVTRADLEAFRSGATGTAGSAGTSATDGTAESASAGAATPSPAGRAAGEETETRIPIRGVRRSTAKAVSQSAFTAPHVTEWVTVDVSATMDLLERLRTRPEFAELKVTPLLLAAKAAMLAARRTPEINATWDDDAGEIVLKHYVHLGIAVDTPRGLLVPNVRNADRLTLPELAGELGRLTATAREGAAQPSDMAGTTFTITNVGVFGVDGGTPILNPGETGILAVGQIDRRPWVVRENGEESIRPRWVTTLAVSFDHRVVDGKQGSRFLADVAAMLRDPGLIAMF